MKHCAERNGATAMLEAHIQFPRVRRPITATLAPHNAKGAISCLNMYRHTNRRGGANDFKSKSIDDFSITHLPIFNRSPVIAMGLQTESVRTDSLGLQKHVAALSAFW